jgi:hypothetical protein
MTLTQKRLAIGAAAAVAIIGIAASLVLGQIGRLIKRGVETAGPPITGTDVTLGSAHVSIFSGQGSLNRLRIGNPKGYSNDDAFDLGHIAIVVDPKSVTSDVVHIRSVVVDGPELLAEFDAGGRSNLNAILDNVRAAAGKSGGGKDSGASGKDKKLIIDDFRFTNAQVRALAPAFQLDRTLKIPTVQLRNLGAKQGGAAAADIANQVLRPVIGAALQAAVAEYVAAQRDKLGDKAKQKLLDKLFK